MTDQNKKTPAKKVAPKKATPKKTSKPKQPKVVMEDQKKTQPIEISATRAPRPEMEPMSEPRWDGPTWISMSNLRLGYGQHIVVGALSSEPKNKLYTEREMINLVKGFLGQTLS